MTRWACPQEPLPPKSTLVADDSLRYPHGVLARDGTARQASGRGLVLMPAAALLVHQVRYWLAYGPQASSALADQGHAYLGSVVPWLIMLAAGGLGCFAARVARGRPRAQRPFLEVWLGAAVALVALYALQESLEGLFATGHPGGLAGVFGHGGWWALPAAAVAALVLALLLRAGETLVRLAAAAQRRRPARRGRVAAPLSASVGLPRLAPLATSAAGRAPPT
jgi:hypothetical protein